MTTNDKFTVIHSTLQADDNMLSVKLLCEIANVSRSGYYTWLKAADNRERKEQRDMADFELIP